MIASMTGFGRGSAQVGSTTATVEMHAVNNRFIDVSTRLPKHLAQHETDVQALIKEAFDRGRINVQVQVERSAEEGLNIQVNEENARAYSHLLQNLRAAAGIEDPVRIEHLLRYSDIFTAAEATDSEEEEAWAAIQEAVQGAIVQMRTMRLQEGKALQTDLEARLDGIERGLQFVEERAPHRIVEARERLHNRLTDLLGDDRLDPDRIEQEIVILADKLDITEECVRLYSHLNVFREALASKEPVGRKLNFLVQEIHREVNTICSKANDAPTAHRAVAMKEEVEKIREQIQNVE